MSIPSGVPDETFGAYLPGGVQQRPRRVLGALLACALLIAACRLGAGEPAPAETGQTPPTEVGAEEPTESADPLPDQTFAVDQSFWHSGFKVTVSEGRFYGEADEFTEEVTNFVALSAAFENLGGGEWSFGAPVAIASDGESAAMLFGLNLPDVPAGLTSNGEMRFEVKDSFNLDGARLVVGTPDQQQAQIPLGPQGGELVALQPAQPPLSGTISMELIDLTFHTAELRADLPGRYDQVEAGKLALTLWFDATSRRGGSWSLHAQNFALIPPGGSALAADGAELGSLQGSAEGLVTEDLSVRFLVEDPPSGEYTLRFTPGDWFVGADEVTEETFAFSLD